MTPLSATTAASMTAAALAAERLPSTLGGATAQVGFGATGGGGATRRELPTGEALLQADVEPQARGLGVQAHAARVLAALAGDPA